MGELKSYYFAFNDPDSACRSCSGLGTYYKVHPHLLVVDPARPTTRKVRFVSEHFSTHLLRADWEEVSPVSAGQEGELLARALAALPRVGAVVL